MGSSYTPPPISNGWNIQTGNFNAQVGNNYIVNTASNGIIGLLPVSPINGSTIIFADFFGTWAINNFTIGYNGQNINQSASSISISVQHAYVILSYNDTEGWLATLMSQAGLPIIADGTYALSNTLGGGISIVSGLTTAFNSAS